MDLLLDAFVEQGVTFLPGKPSLEQMKGYLQRAIRIVHDTRQPDKDEDTILDDEPTLFVESEW
jgi:hypothetical protein